MLGSHGLIPDGNSELCFVPRSCHFDLDYIFLGKKSERGCVSDHDVVSHLMIRSDKLAGCVFIRI